MSGATIEDLVEVTSSREVSVGERVLRVPEGWQQGRGAFGGLVFGALARAILEGEPEKERTLRSLTGELAGPVLCGDARIRLTLVRRGSAVSTITASIEQKGEQVARATGVLGRARPETPRWAPAPPAMGAWREIEPIPLGPPFAPEFSRFFEYRNTGPLPFGGGAEPVVEGWVRPRACGPFGVPELVAIVDAWWPAGFSVERAPRPVGTIAFTAQVFPPPAPLDPAEPLFFRARAVVAHEGYVAEMRELWSPRGELLVINHQTIVWIR
jgi:hypothetical protein